MGGGGKETGYKACSQPHGKVCLEETLEKINKIVHKKLTQNLVGLIGLLMLFCTFSDFKILFNDQSFPDQ